MIGSKFKPIIRILKAMKVFETYWKNRTAISICDLSNGKIERIDISKEHSLDLLDLSGNAILATQSNENEHRQRFLRGLPV